MLSKLLKRIERAWHKQGIDLSIKSTRTGIYLERIVIPEETRGQGIGSKIVRSILKIADNQHKIAFVYPTDLYGLSWARINRFYARLGFIYNHSKHLRTLGYNYMYREPK